MIAERLEYVVMRRNIFKQQSGYEIFVVCCLT